MSFWTKRSQSIHENANAYFARSSVLSEEKKPEEAVAVAETALSFNPNLAPVYGWIGNLQIKLGHAEETVSYVQKAIALSPRDPFLANWLSFIGRAQFYLGRDKEAIGTLLRARPLNPRLSGTHLHLAAAYAFTRAQEEARESLVEFEKLEPDTTISRLKAETKRASDNPRFIEQCERLYEGLRQAGMPE